MTTKLLVSKATSPFSLWEKARMRAKAAAVSTEKVIEMMKLTKRQIEVIMFTAGVGTLEDLKAKKFANKE